MLTAEMKNMGVTTADRIAAPPSRAAIEDMIRRAEREGWLDGHAVYAWGPVEPVALRPGANRSATPLQFGTTANPDVAAKRLTGKLWVDTRVMMVLWVADIDDALRLEAMVQVALDAHGFAIRNGWWDIAVHDAFSLVSDCAAKAGIAIQTDAARRERIETMARQALREARGTR